MNSQQISNLIIENGSGYYDGVDLKEIIKVTGTPVYVYTATGIADTINEFKEKTESSSIKYKYAIKANTNLEIIKFINDHGFGADVVSIGEVHAALRAGVKSEDIIFAGMGKTGSSGIPVVRMALIKTVFMKSLSNHYVI